MTRDITPILSFLVLASWCFQPSLSDALIAAVNPATFNRMSARLEMPVCHFAPLFPHTMATVRNCAEALRQTPDKPLPLNHQPGAMITCTCLVPGERSQQATSWRCPCIRSMLPLHYTRCERKPRHTKEHVHLQDQLLSIADRYRAP